MAVAKKVAGSRRATIYDEAIRRAHEFGSKAEDTAPLTERPITYGLCKYGYQEGFLAGVAFRMNGGDLEYSED
jgi:hypothetical protein